LVASTDSSVRSTLLEIAFLDQPGRQVLPGDNDVGLGKGEGSGHVRSCEDEPVAKIDPISGPGLLWRAVDVDGERLEVGVGGLRPPRGRRKRNRQRGATQAQDSCRDAHGFARSAMAERR
jgi:hypothetical protein